MLPGTVDRLPSLQWVAKLREPGRPLKRPGKRLLRAEDLRQSEDRPQGQPRFCQRVRPCAALWPSVDHAQHGVDDRSAPRSCSVDRTTWPPVVMTSSITATLRPETSGPSASLAVP